MSLRDASADARRPLRLLLRLMAPCVLVAVALPGSASAAPVCTGNAVTVASGVVVPLGLSCTSDSGGTVSPTGFTQPGHGTVSGTGLGTATYQSNAGYCGPDSFTYTVTDGTSVTFTVSITVTLNGQTCTPPANQPPVCTGFAVALEKNTSLPLSGTPCADPEGDPLQLSVVAGTGPAHGSLSQSATGVSYTPAQDYTGRDSFSFIARDDHGNSSQPAVVSILVTEPGAAALLPAGGTFTAPATVLSSGVTVTTSITSPTGGLVGILTPATSPPAPAGYVLLGGQVEIVAPDASVQAPLNITFAIDPATPAASVTVVRDGVAINTACNPSTLAADPDPCFIVDNVANTITVRSSHASKWGLAVPTPLFLAPLDGGALNLVKGGRVVPVKLSLTAAAGALTTGAVELSRLVARSTCSASDSETLTAYAPAGSSNSGTAFRYDPTGGAWIYNLTTKGLTTGVCYRGYVTLNAYQVGYFDLKVVG